MRTRRRNINYDIVNWRMLALVILILLAFIPTSAGAHPRNGVDDLRGRWDLYWNLEGEPLPDLEVLVTEIEPSPGDPSVYQATGCLAIVEEGLYAPLSLQVTDHEDGTYDVVFLSTVVPGVGDSGVFIVSFNGQLEVFGDGVTDDVIGGSSISILGNADWTGSHHDRRRVQCPAADPNVLYFSPDLYMERDRSPGDSGGDSTLFGGSTNIVSTAMRVEIPDGRVVIAPYADDIFTLADFIAEFAFGEQLFETPLVGQPYTFTLLDNLGNPIPGTETADYWFGCPQGAPTNPSATYGFEDHVLISWTDVVPVAGQFEPESDPQIGFYQIELNPYQEGFMLYGMNWGSSPSHVIPWAIFEDGQPGQPDGFDYGNSLSELPDGKYEFRILSFSESHRDDSGFGLECQSVISADNLVMYKNDSDLTFSRYGQIAGTVSDEAGFPLEGIEIAACEYDNGEEPYCRSGFTNADGSYIIPQLFAGDYRVYTNGQAGWVNEFYNNIVFYDQADRVMVYEATTTPGIDFGLNPAGSISGTVFDDNGNPLGRIAVDLEAGGYGACTDENGYYILQGVPFGTHNVVAGQQFCDPHPFAESTMVGVAIGAGTPDAVGVDFFLGMGSGPKFVNVQPEHMWADSGGWDESELVTLSFDGFSTSIIAPHDGYILFDLSDSGIAPGAVVHVTDGTDWKDLLVVAASFDGVDEIENKAWGTAPDGYNLGVAVLDEDGGSFWVDGLEAIGQVWTIDFDDYGQDFGTVTDAWLHVFDEDGDSTLAHFAVPPPPPVPYVNIQPDHMWADTGNWPAGASITLEFDSFSITQTADPGGLVWFDLTDSGIAPGATVSVTDGAVTINLQVVSATFDGVDEIENTASGTAPAGAWLSINVVDANGDQYWVDGVQADGLGNWLVDFDDYGQEFGPVADAWVHVFDEDGDSTLAHYTP